MRRMAVVGTLAAAVLAASAWAGAGTSAPRGGLAAGKASASSVTISNESGTTWTCGFNPYNGSVNFLSFGTVYEELVFVNALQSAKATPWLASSYRWSNHNRTLTFTIRKGVRWSDGKPFGAADVVFSFDLLKKHPALDLNADWSVLRSVTQVGASKVAFTFKTSAVPYFYYIAGATPIVAKHVWASVANPVTYTDAHPVGTGPYTMSKCSPQVIVFQKNPGYWQRGVPKIQTVYYPSFTSNDPANQELADDQAQWGSQFIPNIKGYYLSKSPYHHIWFPPVANVSIFINLTDPVLSALPVRQAMAYAIDRARVSQIGEYGYEPPSNQTGIVSPTYKSWLPAGAAKKFSYNPAKAIATLKAAGYKESGGVFHTPSGKPLSFTIVNIGGYSDWVASVQVIQSELSAVGIKIQPENLSSTTYDADIYNGKFQLAYGAETGGPAPYYELRQLLYSKNTAPIGQTASSNYERFSDRKVDALIDAYGATTSSALQHSIVRKLAAVMTSRIPVIPVTEQVDWYQYNTKSITGWVTPSNPFAQPAAYNTPDIGVMLLHLRPKG
ncbi:MAG TPA: ABC transporter substrate-binding protein [Gaiellaceae bacterium]|nr:ABC transporter substrate-binding protein [Gaiellaceae bacterium]